MNSPLRGNVLELALQRIELEAVGKGGKFRLEDVDLP